MSEFIHTNANDDGIDRRGFREERLGTKWCLLANFRGLFTLFGLRTVYSAEPSLAEDASPATNDKPKE